MNDVLGSEQLVHLQAVLAHWDIPPVTSIEAVQAGHTVFKVTTVGPTCTLKDISASPDLTRLAFTRSVLAHVARAGLRVPVPLLSRSAQPAVPFGGRFYLLSEYIEASTYPTDPGLQGELFFNTGQAIGRLHRALASYPDPEVSRQTWRENLAGQVPTWIADLGAELPAAQAGVVQRVGRERGAAIAAALLGLPEQLIHRDCHPGNVLVQGTRVVGFIDCDHLCIGPRVFDLAYYAVHHVKWVTDDEVATRRWLANLPHLLTGYRSVHPLLHQEAAALPAAMMAYHLLLAHWFLGVERHEAVALEVRALDWHHRHYDAVLSASERQS
jgi:Ser/Thr protein kinase RdoA (MazF antagonist)